MVESIVCNYIRLKKYRNSVKTNSYCIKNNPKRAKVYANRLNVLDTEIKKLEKNDEITKFLSLKNDVKTLKKTIIKNINSTHDTSEVEKQLTGIQNIITSYEDEAKNIKLTVTQDGVEYVYSQNINASSNKSRKNKTDTANSVDTSIDTASADSINSNETQKPEREINYYILTTAWTIANDKLLNVIESYIDRSNYINKDKSNNMITWKYNYDTDTEIATVKAIQIGSVHMIDVLRDIFEVVSDIEIFGKIQKY